MILLLKKIAQCAIAAVLMALPIQGFNAVSDTLPAVNTVPRFALVIGNGKYREVPLKNAPNDAKAMADHLTRMGFDVTLKLDATRNEMIEAIRAFGAELAKRKSVGLFYYAGHGAQLAWHNYLIPVDAVIEKLEDMQAKTVELSTLLEGLVKAKNPMNVIILDACRDNPFGNRVSVQQKGLSQFDAPPGSLLAYATSPGNTATDGEGANGLYTENLLRELKIPEAKIEDVFKRVRLNVRRRSEGQQIPWESTSLEEDFYFLPPKAVRKLTPDEAERLFDQELALWENIKGSTDPAPLEDYLRRFPSGKFSELAQFRLDRVLAQQGEKAVRVETDRTAANPYSKGTARANPDFALGDSYVYRKIDLQKQAEVSRTTTTITEITDEEVIFNKGTLVRDPMGNVLKNRRGEFADSQGGGAQFYVSEYSIGKKWTARYRRKAPDGIESSTEIDFKVVAKEKITVPAGEFEAFKVVGKGYSTRGATLDYVYWIAPDKVRRVLAYEDTTRGEKSGRIVWSERFELVSFRELRAPK